MPRTVQITHQYREKMSRCLSAAAVASAMALLAPCAGHAQGIDPDTMTPRADGTNLARVDLTFSHFGQLDFTSGVSWPKSHFDEYNANLALQHYFEIAGQRFNVGISQGIGAFDNFEANGINESNSPGSGQWGATNTTFEARYWPFVNASQQAFADVAAFLTPPDGTNSESRTINIATNAWQGDIEIGGHKGFGPNFSIDAAADVLFMGDRARPGGSFSTDPTYTLQLWANWACTSQFRVSVGYAGSWGGQIYFDEPTSTGTVSYNEFRSGERQQLRAQVAYWWTPRILTAVEVAHDVSTPGGYQLDFEAIGQVKVLF